MSRDKRYNRFNDYNIEKLNNMIDMAVQCSAEYIYISKRVVKTAQQLLKARGLFTKIKIKTHC
jgi:hypothetical protein